MEERRKGDEGAGERREGRECRAKAQVGQGWSGKTVASRSCVSI